MGGNALKNTYTRRYDAKEYFVLVKEVVGKLRGISKVVNGQDIPAYREKESFGDMDVLYYTHTDNYLSIDEVVAQFSPNEIIRNGEVISFDYKEFQIDLIHTPWDRYDYALSYFSWNDVGNLIGKLAHQLGLKHGHKGLFYPLRDGSHLVAEILLTKSHAHTLKLLGLDFMKFKNGFDNLDQIFNFVAESKYYNPENYLLENLNHVAKLRDRKRDTYKKFLEFGKTYTGPVHERNKDKSQYLELFFDEFPHEMYQFRTFMRHIVVNASVKKKFNGNIVSEYTGLTGKSLGGFMTHLKDKFFFQDDIILYLSEEQIKANILAEYASYRPKL